MLNKFYAKKIQLFYRCKESSLCHSSWSNPLKRIFHEDDDVELDDDDDNDNDVEDEDVDDDNDDDDDVVASHDRRHGSHPGSINWRHPTKSPHNTPYTTLCIVSYGNTNTNTQIHKYKCRQRNTNHT